VYAALHLPPRRAVVVTAAGIAAIAVGTFTTGQGLGSFGGNAGALVGFGLAGYSRRQHRDRLTQTEQLLAQTRRANTEQARAAALDERSRIAREIHDVLAHSLGALAVQLNAADALLSDGQDPGRAQAHVSRARRLAVDGLTETRRAVGALRGDSLPLPELLNATLAEHQADAGSTARLDVCGAVRDLPPDVSLAAYRTAQEAISNARKHAPGAPLTLTLDYQPDELVLTITDTPPAGVPPPDRLAATGGGYGLTGLAERAQLLGGSLHAGPDAQGWTVTMKLPT
jgi:signal transduction histidine kinase